MIAHHCGQLLTFHQLYNLIDINVTDKNLSLFNSKHCTAFHLYLIQFHFENKI